MESDHIHLNLENEMDFTIDDKSKVIDEMMTLYSKKVYLLAYSFVKDQGLAEDISQEVFLRCYQYLKNFRGEASIKSWLYRITVNLSKDFIRKKGFQILKFPIEFFDGIKKSESTEEAFLKMIQNEQLLQNVLSLPIKYREVIVLHYFNELKIEEISEMLEVNANTVKTRLARGRSKLKETITTMKGDT
ncbi:sigma-70 family RNA polymerase sigma factor [Fredinandcohnia quinoae]|uniref:Sigma-70 family RNA polymerase sigma factor n=1 Tax=Fredinandcohnia quinoae TaxID=2918902 RepID=A0AAW5DV89_9BACI|nr:sigma-70 family RNA polymerase sigma factor [Fredinandcohnia sp. SECRCQ15]MCH1624263.1 sigma-70 family RNA polymerase sigma factor [Fredinandcohnia sp. SECRCQ15]